MKELPALRVMQWLPGWSSVDFNKAEHRAEPQQWFYQFSISAGHLKALSGIYPRSTRDRSSGSSDLGIQRRHEVGRSDEIARFVEYGFPWSSLSKRKRESEEYNDLRKPGWLPTAIVVNVLTGRDLRLGRRVDPNDLVEISDSRDGTAKIHLPERFKGSTWRPKLLPPIEVIDGQHRLWAFEEGRLPDDFELPVVAFKGLDISWQAYLFYTINIKPKRINASLAFDLYPLLRTEDWLSKFEDHIIYRETRAQELVDALWAHQRSPWHRRINMLGETGHKGRMVSQSSWIHSLLATYMKVWEGRKRQLGGLFGAPLGAERQTPNWNRTEQAAILIFAGLKLRDATRHSDAPWAEGLRAERRPEGFSPNTDLAFFGPHSLLNQDQGIRAFLYITNDFLFLNADDLDLATWGGNDNVRDDDEKAVNRALDALQDIRGLSAFLGELCGEMASYDWRSSDAVALTDQQALLKAAFRGSGGYRQLRIHVAKHLSRASGRVGKTAVKLLNLLGE